MEYAKDEIYTVNYINSEDKLKIHTERRRFILLLVSLATMFSIINFILVFNFFSILTKM